MDPQRWSLELQTCCVNVSSIRCLSTWNLAQPYTSKNFLIEILNMELKDYLEVQKDIVKWMNQYEPHAHVLNFLAFIIWNIYFHEFHICIYIYYIHPKLQPLCRFFSPRLQGALGKRFASPRNWALGARPGPVMEAVVWHQMDGVFGDILYMQKKQTYKITMI